MPLQEKAPSPFLKWAGGKGHLLRQFEVEGFYPKSFSGYLEPFLGSGAVFFHVRAVFHPKRVILSDHNAELINCYQVVQGRLDELIKLLRFHRDRHSERHYGSLRRQRPGELSPVKRAARLIYLNKTCYNGLYRVNSEGQFNVPMGSYARPKIFDGENLQCASEALKGVELKVCDFRECAKFARAGDFIYLDPPYHPISATSSFTAYTERTFGEKDQEALAEVFSRLDKKGGLVMLSNSDCRFIRDLYRGFRINQVMARRAINSVGSKRGEVPEVVVRNYDERGR